MPCYTRDGKPKPNANKVEAYGPGLEPGSVLPGFATNLFFYCFPFCEKIIDLPGEQINDP